MEPQPGLGAQCVHFALEQDCEANPQSPPKAMDSDLEETYQQDWTTVGTCPPFPLKTRQQKDWTCATLWSNFDSGDEDTIWAQSDTKGVDTAEMPPDSKTATQQAQENLVHVSLANEVHRSRSVWKWHVFIHGP